ncbi:peptide chain release factor N(5)-glutamine methyltransferase [Bifidobacterium avesanii]|uniref:Release factor glutamine methyltransferase n=1 Tax=Bifidobacterium avesanii TaxID=1798157 RepID=A0A7K3TI60_9BIFI|nr:peptide chain release factor N(5)-glutamine methyltransferase [Bifidobacterium avesanii]NEG78787.1 peptide chain release factor N(5)-glutamine methyltransferase [Bifidobacterium avesanii]
MNRPATGAPDDAPEAAVPVPDVIRAAAARLADAGVDTPVHDAKLLLAHALGLELRDVDKAMLMGDAVSVPPEFDAMVSRRANREPLQHITGHAPFRYLDLEVGPGVFIPRPETELVVQEGIDWINRQGRLYSPRVVDLCAGSGAIGLAVASEVPGAEVWAVELSERTAAWTRRNLEHAARMNPQVGYNYHLELGDATSRSTLAPLDGTVDLVLSNPPYVPESEVPDQPEVRDHDPALALYGGSADGLLIPERIVRRAFALLRSGGLFVMEHDVSQGDRLAAYAQAAGFAHAVTKLDYTGRPRYLVAEKA